MFSYSFVRFDSDLVDLICRTFDLSEGASRTVMMVGVLLCIAVPYLLGSVNFGIILSRKLYGADIRDSGSGNAGTTNMLRVYGKKAAALTLAGDMLKGGIAVLFGSLILNIDGPVDGSAIAGLFVVLGHMFPCFYHFRGGKGVATTAMVILVTRPLVFLLLLGAFLVIVIGTKYVSLGSVISVMLYPVLLNRLDTYHPTGWNVTCAVIIMALVVFMHRSNLSRLYHRKESKISFGKKEPAGATHEAQSEPSEPELSAPKTDKPNPNTSKKKKKAAKKRADK